MTHDHDCWKRHHACALAEIERLLKALNKANATNRDHERKRDAPQVQAANGR